MGVRVTNLAQVRLIRRLGKYISYRLPRLPVTALILGCGSFIFGNLCLVLMRHSFVAVTSKIILIDLNSSIKNDNNLTY